MVNNMERVHYRRYTPSKLHNEPHDFEIESDYRHESNNERNHNYQNDKQNGQNSFVEKLIVQGMISGIILAVVLLFGIIDNAHTANIRRDLSHALSGNITAEQVAGEVNRFLQEQLPISQTEQQTGSTGYTEATELPLTDPINLQSTETTDIHATDATDISTTEASRIDEDILREIIGDNTENNDLQTTAPEPMILPEL